MQKGDVVIGLSGGAGSMALLDILIGKDYIGGGEVEGAKEQGEKKQQRGGEKKYTWMRGWVVYVDFSGIIPGVSFGK